MNKIISLFAFDPSIDPNQFAANCREWGVNTAILHPGFFSDRRMIEALDKNRMGLWLNLPVFYNPEFLAANPDYYSLTSWGQRAIQDWCHFVCPSREDYLENFVREKTALAARLQPEFISLDFIRYFVFWELVALGGKAEVIEDGCYCPVCLAGFEQVLGQKIPQTIPSAEFIRRHARTEWGRWKSQRITETATRLISAVREASPGSKIWIKTVPWRQNDLDGAILHVAGQDIPALASLVDGVAPMAFTHILRQTPAWKKELLAEVKAITGKAVISYVQVEKVLRAEDISPEQFEAELKEGLAGDSAGISLFHYDFLAQGAAKVEILKRYLKEG